MFSKEKFKTLIHYACASVDDPAKLGAVKLNKIMWFSDVFSFSELGEAMTGATYMKLQYGPVPRAMMPTLREMVSEGRIRVDEVEYFGKTKKQFVSLSDPDMSIFSENERAIADYVIRQITNGFTAAAISNLTHDAIWKLAELGEDIPMTAVLSSDLGVVTAADAAWIIGRNSAKEAA